MRIPRRRALLGVAVAHFLLTGAAAAERVRPHILVETGADTSCPDATELVERVERRLLPASVVDPNERFDVSVERGPEVTSAHLVVTRADGSRASRVVQGASCDDVFESVAFITAMTIDPATASQSPPDAAPPLPAIAPVHTRAATAAPSPAPAPTVERRPVADCDVCSTSSSGVERRRGERLEFALGVLVEGTTAIAPYLAPTGRLFIALHGSAFDAVAGFRLSVARSLENEVSIDAERGAYFTYTAGRAEGCLGPSLAAARFGVEGCAVFDAGALHGEGFGVEPPHEEARFWADLGALGRLGYSLTGHLALVAESGFIVPLTRYRYEVHGPDTLVFQPPPVALSLGGGLALALE